MSIYIITFLALVALAGCGSTDSGTPEITNDSIDNAKADDSESIEGSPSSQSSLTSVDLSPRPPIIGKVQSYDIVLNYEKGSWNILGLDTTRNSLIAFSLATDPISGVLTSLIEMARTPNSENETLQITVGSVRWPSIVYAGRILTTKPLYEDFSEQYGRDFDVQLIKLPVSWFPAKTKDEDYSKLLEAIEVQVLFDESDDGHPTILDIFPKTSFEDEGWKISGKFGVGIGGFLKQSGVEMNSNSRIGVSFDYTPLIAKVVADGIGNQSTWRIKEVKDRPPIGQIDYYCTVLVPRKIREASAKLNLKMWFKESENQYLQIPTQSLMIDFGRKKS